MDDHINVSQVIENAVVDLYIALANKQTSPQKMFIDRAVVHNSFSKIDK